MLKRSLGARLRRWILDRVVNGPVATTREAYDRERADLPHERIGRITAYGKEPFVSDIKRALSLLADGYPYGYSLVQRYIHAIESKELVRDREKFPLAGFGARAEETNPEGRLPVTPERYAAFLVRVAAHRRRGLLYAPFSKRADLFAQKKEAQAMKILLRSRGFA